MILVFAGAGASKAVSPKQYPTTVEYFDRLPQEIKNDKIFDQVLRFVKHKSESEVVDIEQVLWALDDWRVFADAMTDDSRLPGWLISGNKIIKATGQSVDWQQVLNHARSLDSHIDSLAGKINRNVYEWYSEVPGDGDLKRSWIPLLSSLASIDRHIEIFTTNYDLVLERAVELGRIPVELGRVGTLQPILDVKQWDVTDDASSRGGLLTKLHGSVDWSHGPRAIHVGTPTFRGNHQDHVIIYPGYKGTPTEPPFREFHQYFERAVGHADALVFVGFAFRDPYINDVLRRRVSNAPVVVINPEKELRGIPFLEPQLLHIPLGLDAKSTNSAVDALNQRIAK